MEKILPNEELAKDYLSTVSSYCSDSKHGWLIYLRASRRISKMDINLQEFYISHGSLKKIRGIGTQTKKILELILKEGAERAKRKIEEQKSDEEIEEEQDGQEIEALITEEHREDKSYRKDKTVHSWENAVKLLEDCN